MDDDIGSCSNALGFDHNVVESLSLCDALKCCLLKFAINGADTMLLSRKISRTNMFEQHETPQDSKGIRGFGHFGAEGNKLGQKSVALLENEKMSARLESKLNVFEESQMVNSSSVELNVFPLNLLAFSAPLLLKCVGFQFNLMYGFFKFPLWFTYHSFMFLLFPIHTLHRIRAYFVKKLLRVGTRAKRSVADMVMRLGFALFLSSYVCLILLGLLVFGFVFGGMLTRKVVEQPVKITETLNLDYTKPSPVAFVPLLPFSAVQDNVEDRNHVGARVIPYNHKLQLTVSLVMPESEYNRKLGIFQVKVEFMSSRAKVTASSSKPCMLRFKSKPIQFIGTIIKSVSLIAGLRSESQILNVRMNEFTEGLEPTAYLKVMLEQRAEFNAGGGIPEVYEASLLLESDLPQIKRLIWNWRRTVCVWISISVFLTELAFVFIFCRPIIIPTGRPKIAKLEPHCNIISWCKLSS